MSDWSFSAGQFTRVWHTQTPDNGGGWRYMPRFLVMHFTAGRTGLGAVRELTTAGGRQASAHFVIDRDGTTWQICSCDKIAWHAGRSNWRGINGLNSHSIGIEFVNKGKLDIVGGKKPGDPKRYFPWWDQGKHKTENEVPHSEVIEGVQKNGNGKTYGWQTFPEVQLRAGVELTIQLLFRYPSIIEIVGHDDISPGRKPDPGPAFPMRRFQSLLTSRQVLEAIATLWTGREAFTVARNVNCRTGPSLRSHRLRFSPLRAGTKLESFMKDGEWRYVKVLGKPRLEGWVHENFLTADPSRSTSGLKAMFD